MFKIAPNLFNDGICCECYADGIAFDFSFAAAPKPLVEATRFTTNAGPIPQFVFGPWANGGN